jgi:hypothetical protein
MKLKIADETIFKVIACVENMRESMWQLGDILVCLVDQHAAAGYKRSEVINAVAGDTGCTYTFLDDHERTSRKWPKIQRSLAVDWSIYRNSSPDDIRLVEQAEVEGWNVTMFREMKAPGDFTPSRMVANILSILGRLNHKRQAMPPAALEIISDIQVRMEQLEEILGSAQVAPVEYCGHCGQRLRGEKCTSCNEGAFQLEQT